MDEFDPENTVMDEVLGGRNVNGQQLRNALATMLFRGDDVYKPIALLSGGERARVRLAQLLLDKPNVLVLDEPTNHLDIASCEGTGSCAGRLRRDGLLRQPRPLFPGSCDKPPPGSEPAGHDRLRRHLQRAGSPSRKSPPSQRSNDHRGDQMNSEPSRSNLLRQRSAKRRKPLGRRTIRTRAPYGRLTLKELEKQITETEVAVSECQGNLGMAVKDAGRRQEMQAEYKRLSQKLDALEAEYYAREQ